MATRISTGASWLLLLLPTLGAGCLDDGPRDGAAGDLTVSVSLEAASFSDWSAVEGTIELRNVAGEDVLIRGSYRVNQGQYDFLVLDPTGDEVRGTLAIVPYGSGGRSNVFEAGETRLTPFVFAEYRFSDGHADYKFEERGRYSLHVEESRYGLESPSVQFTL